MVQVVDKAPDTPTDAEIERLAKVKMASEQAATPEIERILPIKLSELVATYPTMRPPVVNGILRVGEVANIIASPKVGKSWLGANLAFCIADGRPWLGHDTKQGRVLILDNELHKETLSDRLERVRLAMMIEYDSADNVEAVCLRGLDLSINEMGERLAKIEPGYYSLIILDALYRTLPDGVSENDNAHMMAVYNRLDHYAMIWGSAIAVIHHSSKGDQSTKGVTDVGSGAGSISRAADCHLTIRPHETDGLCVLERVNRSFAPADGVSIRFDFPIWNVVETKAEVRKSQPRSKESKESDSKDCDDILSRLANSRVQQKDIIDLYGGRNRFNRLMGGLMRKNLVQKVPINANGKRSEVWYEIISSGSGSGFSTGTSGTQDQSSSALPIGSGTELGGAA